MQEKRQPLIIDRYLRQAPAHLLVESAQEKLIQQRMRRTNVFVLNDDAVLRMAEVIKKVPDLLIREFQFARAPYDVMTLEIPNQVLLHEAVNGPSSSEQADKAISYFIDHNQVYVLTGGNLSSPDAPPRLMPLVYRLSTPWSQDERTAIMDFTGFNGVELDAVMWGNFFSGFTREDALSDDHPFSLMRKNHSFQFLPGTVSKMEKRDRRMLLASTTGDLKNILVALLLLNRPAITRFVHKAPRHRGFLKGKLVNYFEHTVVTIDLDATVHLRAEPGLSSGEVDSRRRHNVCGTWVRNSTTREFGSIGCVHEWRHDPAYVGIDDPHDPDHFVCSVCEGKTWWRRQTVRGDATKGWVHKDAYEVIDRSRRARPDRSA